MDLQKLIPLISQVTLILLVAAVGLRAQWRDVVATFRTSTHIWQAVTVVNVVVPAAALVACAILPIDMSVRIGLVIVAISPLAPLVTEKALQAGLDASRTVGLYVLLTLFSVVLVPATLAVLSDLYPPDAAISIWPIAKLTTQSVFLPLAAGVLIATVAPALARKLAGPLTIAGYVVLTLLAIPVVWTQADKFWILLGNGTVLAMVFTTMVALVAGHLVGRPTLTDKKALAIAAATRHPGIAGLIISANFPGQPKLMLVVMLFVGVSVVLSFAYLQWAKRQAASSPADELHQDRVITR